MFRNVFQWSVFVVLLSMTNLLFAESVVIMKTEGPSELSETFQKELERQVSESSEFELLPSQKVGISDLILGAGCDSPTPECLTQLSGLINSDHLIFARVKKEGDKNIVSVRFFNFKDSTFTKVLSKVAFTSEKELRAVVQKLLFGDVGELFVDVGGSEAEVFVDGKSYGKAPQTISGLTLGSHKLMVRSTYDGAEKTQNIELEAGKPTQVSFGFDSSPSPKSKTNIVKYLPGAGVLIVGLAGIGYGTMQSLEIENLNTKIAHEESDRSRFVEATPEVGAHIKDGSDVSNWSSYREDVKSKQIPQYVGYGVGAVGVVVGSYLLYRALGATENVEVSIRPSLQDPQATVRLHF